VFTHLLLAAPKAFIAVLGGLAMLRVLQTAFVVSFKDKFSLGALITFLVTVADVPILNIGAPFWDCCSDLASLSCSSAPTFNQKGNHETSHENAHDRSDRSQRTRARPDSSSVKGDDLRLRGGSRASCGQ
jgi:hypothetical protein